MELESLLSWGTLIQLTLVKIVIPEMETRPSCCSSLTY
jgi:hypothetical protein